MGEERGGKVGQTENRTQGGTGREIFKGNVDVIETLFYEITFEIFQRYASTTAEPTLYFALKMVLKAGKRSEQFLEFRMKIFIFS